MNITLKTFQKQRARELRKTFAMAQMSWQHFGQKQIISLTAPTGAGKTILMARFIEDLLCGDEEGMFPKRSVLTGEWYIRSVSFED